MLSLDTRIIVHDKHQRAKEKHNMNRELQRNDKGEVLQTQSQNGMASNSDVWNQQYIKWSRIRNGGGIPMMRTSITPMMIMKMTTKMMMS